MELKTKELESKLELEQTTRSRLEVQIARLKETVDKLQTEVSTAKVKEQQAQDQLRKLQRSLRSVIAKDWRLKKKMFWKLLNTSNAYICFICRELKEEHNNVVSKEAESMQKRKDLEKKCEIAETEATAAKTDLRLALKRIEDLQSAIQGELEDTNSENTDRY